MAKIPDDMSYKLIAKVGIISQLDYGDTKEANIIAWSGHRPMMDIRGWDKTGTRPRYGLSLSESEMNKLITSYLKWRSNHNTTLTSEKPVYKTSKYAVYEVIGVLSGFSKGFRKELTLSSWMNDAPSIDLRWWKEKNRGSGRGISFTLEEADTLIRMLLCYRDEEKTPKLVEVESLDCEPHQRKRIRCTFKAGEEIDVIAKISDGESGPDLITYIESYSGYPGLESFVPEKICNSIMSEASRQVLGNVTEKVAAPKKSAAGKKSMPDATASKKASATSSDTSVDPKIKVISRNMMLASSFGERIAATIDQSGVSIAELSRRAGIGTCTPSYWKTRMAKEYVISGQLDAFAKVLGVRAKWLATGKGPILRKPGRAPLAEDALIPEPISALDEEAAPAASEFEAPSVQEDVTEPVAAENAAPVTAESMVPEPKEPIIHNVAVLAGNPNERALSAINACIACLPGSNMPDARAIHRFLSGLRAGIEEALLFGSFLPDPEDAEKDTETLMCISSLIASMKDLALTAAAKDDLYTVLSEKRFDIEIRRIHS